MGAAARRRSRTTSTVLGATLDERGRATISGATFTPVASGLTLVETFDVSFRIRRLTGPGLAASAGRPAGPLPAVVKYIGYGGGRGLPHEGVLWAVAGYAHLVMDTRGQGSSWTVGDTPGLRTGRRASASGLHDPGHPRPATYYYRRVFTDAVRAVEAVRAAPRGGPDRVGVTGGSQGGGIALAARRSGRPRGRDAGRAVPVRLPARRRR